MVPLTTAGERSQGEQSQPNLKLIIHRTIHQLLDREEERPGWYGDPLSTAWVGLALQAHDGHTDEIADIADELEDWFADVQVSHEYQVAALGLMAEFFQQFDRGRPIYDEIRDQFFAQIDEEIARREESDGPDAARFQFFNSYIYLYCALVGIKAYDALDEYREFLSSEVEGQREATWTEYDRMAFVETVALEVAEYDAKECRDVLQKMRRVDEEDLNEYELIPLVWFFQEQQDAIRDALSQEKFAQEVVAEIRQNLWQRLYDELPFELYLADEIGYEFTPDVQQLALLDQLLGRLDNSIRVFSAEQLEEHEAEVAEEKDQAIRENRRRKNIIEVGAAMLIGFILVDVVIAYPPSASFMDASHFVQGITVFLLMHMEWRLEDISKDFGLTESVPMVRDVVNMVEDRNWPAWILRLAFGLIGAGVVGYFWVDIQAFFLAF
ncbi:hypothetical protein [Halegenticoccus soli]|uniref:hypothetical protein n=1 Tax=Halegenticoccus soli TaxID=1985678 RepID=UPI000C6E162C|nr:hypothetical protein [Halegenticoccus soli]